jgi:hypothetical protein
MTTSLFKPNWSAFKRRLKQKYAQLTDTDLSFFGGKEEEVLPRLQKCLGKSPLEIAWLVDELTAEKSHEAGLGWSLLRNEEWRRFPTHA